MRRTPGLKDKERFAAKKSLFSFTKKFIVMLVVVLVPVSLLPEPWFAPLNRVTAVLSGDFLRLLSIDATVRGTLIMVPGFSANVIAECSAIHLVVICGSFFYAFPSKVIEKWKGFLIGIAVLFFLNVLRISAVTLIGMAYPAALEAAHIYLGQLGMLIAVVAICLAWCQWISNDGRFDGPFGFLARFILFSGLPFLVWIPMHRVYLSAVDALVRSVFALFSYVVVMPDSEKLHYHVFSVIALAGFLMAIEGVGVALRLRWLGLGFLVLSSLLVGYRLCVVAVTAFHLQWMAPVALLFYLGCVYALPLAAALLCLFKAGLWRKMSVQKESPIRVPV